MPVAKILKISSVFLITALFFGSCDSKNSKVYQIYPKSETKTSGNVEFIQKGKEVILNVKVSGLKPGLHAIHIHEKADCSSADGSSAGGHWNPTEHDHGKWGEAHFHRGDIGNLEANEEGVAELNFKTDQWCIGCEDTSKNVLGHSIIIHADEDDFETQPTGNAGGRVGCVEIL